MKKYASVTLFLFFALALTFSKNGAAGIPPAKEFRGVWIATINNIDWPSAPGLPTEVQKRELRELIGRIEKLNMNVVIFQVRPAADAFYSSQTEPWSYFLSGKQGAAPTPYFDPLGYAIELCHAKGMELHAWFNPFRVRNNGFYKLAPGNFAARNPQYTYLYDNKLFLDPGVPQVRSHLVKVIMEVVRKYDIDAIHLDDYFYPYPIKGQKFPDSKSFIKYGKGYYPKRLSDWRRENINKFIAAIHDSIKAVKPTVKLGISPFGVWRNRADDPNGSPGVKGTTSYDDLYADVYKWLANDWIDYIIPQLYWEQGNRFGDFGGLTKWWNDHSFGKQLYIGQALFKSTGATRVFVNPKEISEQISILRKFENVGGFALYSASHLASLSEEIISKLYSNLLPSTRTSDPPNPATTANGTLSGLTPGPIAERRLMANKKSIADTIAVTYKSVIDNNLPIPEKFSAVKSRTGVEVSWQTVAPKDGSGLKYRVIIFEPVKGGGYRNFLFETTDGKMVLIPRKSAFNPAKVLFGIVSVGENGYQSPFPKLFKIRGRRIKFN